MKNVVLAILFATFASAAPVWEKQKAEETVPRNGVGNFIDKAKRGEEVAVAYFGGSITAMNGWRNKTQQWLQTQFSKSKFREIHAAIGGTGSSLGAFRCGHDVVEKKPDLVFVEFATNDSGVKPAAIWTSMEGIVRQIWRGNPKCDIVFAYTITSSMTNDYMKGFCNQSASAMEQLAEYYGIPSVNFGPRVAKELAEGRLIMSAKELGRKFDPYKVEQDKDGVDEKGRIVFSPEGVHPYDKGHELYFTSVKNLFFRMDALPPVDHAADLAKEPFVADNWEKAKMVPVTPAMLKGEWTKLPENSQHQKSFGGRQGQIWFTETPGAELSFSFEGTIAKVYDLLGPDGGQVDIYVDGKKITQTPRPRFDSYCTYWRIATLDIGKLPQGRHDVRIVLDKEQPSRQPVAFRLKNPDEELKAKKYNGTKFWPSQLLILGDLI